MCGFAGVVTWDDRYRMTPETLKRMGDAVAHRGPDGEGFHINHQDAITPNRPQVALAFRRLAILDPDPRSNQPFTDGRHWLVFNGEIYNFRDLRKELSRARPDYAWRTTGDTEVLLLAYAVWGEKCVEHLNGMFAFAVWDDVEKSLYLARDRMGQKPLYVAYVGRNGATATTSSPAWPGEALPAAIIFGSELPAVIRCSSIPEMSRRIDTSAVTQYLHWGYIPSPETIYNGVQQIMPGYTLTGCIAGFRSNNYFKPSSETIKRTDDSDECRRRVRDAVTRQLVSDVPLGCFLSGGIDSSVIAAAMRASGQQAMTFSIGFDDPRYDESQYAAEVAKHLGTSHHTFHFRPNAAEDLPKLAAAFGEPFGDSSALPTHYLARETRSSVKVALSGDGGDELFGGYDRYKAMDVARQVIRATTRLPWVMIAPMFRAMLGGHPKSRHTKAARFFTSLAMASDRRYSFYLRLFDGDTLAALQRFEIQAQDSTRSYGPTHNDRFSSWFARSNLDFGSSQRISDPVRAALALDRMMYLPNDLLTKVDRCSMMHGLEVRSPFMDHELVQFAAGLTTDQLLKGGPKRMLREAFKDDLPAWVFKRKKMGFAVPIGDWFRGELRPMLRDTLFSAHAFGRSHFDMKVVERLVDEHEQQRVDHSQRLYVLLMLELWWNTARPGAV